VPAASNAASEADSQLARHVASMRKDTSVIRFFETHRWLLTDPRFAKEATIRLGTARHHLAATRAQAARARAAITWRTRKAHKQQLLARSPRTAICKVFKDHCHEALQVARCESNYHTTAQNGQYLGLFQMGTSERRLFGHGETAVEQAQAAYRYFVRSGRDWSPWSCKPWS
jgi:hypothetical protein